MPRTATSRVHAHLLGERLRAARREIGITQKQLGERLGVSGSYVARIEAGRDNLTVGQLANIAEALGVGLDIAFRVPDDRVEDYRQLDDALQQY